MHKNFNHALIIGGTGMLLKASLKLAESSQVSLISRNANKDLINYKTLLNPIETNYNDISDLKEKVEEAINNFGNIDLIISWIHSTAPTASIEIAKLVSQRSQSLYFYEILSSSYANPSDPEILENKKNQFNSFQNIDYHQIVLGFVPEANNKSRWLTNDEISLGVINALSSEKLIYTVGTTKPWALKP